MRTFIRALAAVSLVIPLVVACSDDDSTDNPGGGATTGEGGDGGTGATGGKNTGGTAGKPTGGTAGNDTGGASDGGEPMTQGGGGAGPITAACDLDALEDGGTVGDALDDGGTLASGHSYLLEGLTKVTGTLTIEPCVVVYGDTGTKGTLVIMPGGELIAEGEADAPIIFTSEAEPGERAPGDWGGVMLLGNGSCNDATDDAACQIEGLTDGTEFGAVEADADNETSSGSLKYVRIEYPGVDLDGQGNEINGLTLAGVGSETTISHVMVSNTLDDCFEVFGGAVNMDHVVAHNCGDDMFDTDNGYSGMVQFAFGKQVETITADPSGFEMDNDKTALDKAPVSTPKFANVTLCGDEDSASGPSVGMVLRNGTDGAIVNALVTGFSAGASVRNVPNTEITVTGSLVFGNTAIFDASHAGGDTWLSDQDGNDTATPDDFGDCFGAVPEPFPAAAIEGVEPTDHADETATFVGAFADATDNWMTGAWVDWATE
jgi:hypothetical protein